MLAQMMPEISIKAKFSQCYSNHSVRATSISAMDNAGVEARHIMRASGHRSESSIRIYSKQLSENKQREISDNLNGALQTEPTKYLNKPSVFGLSGAEM
jgi:integrase